MFLFCSFGLVHICIFTSLPSFFVYNHFVIFLESGVTITAALLLSCKIDFVILYVGSFHMNFRNVFSRSEKNVPDNLIKIAVHLYIALGIMDTVLILVLLICEHWHFLFFLFSFPFFFVIYIELFFKMFDFLEVLLNGPDITSSFSAMASVWVHQCYAIVRAAFASCSCQNSRNFISLSVDCFGFPACRIMPSSNKDNLTSPYTTDMPLISFSYL